MYVCDIQSREGELMRYSIFNRRQIAQKTHEKNINALTTLTINFSRKRIVDTQKYLTLRQQQLQVIIYFYLVMERLNTFTHTTSFWGNTHAIILAWMNDM